MLGRKETLPIIVMDWLFHWIGCLCMLLFGYILVTGCSGFCADMNVFVNTSFVPFS